MDVTLRVQPTPSSRARSRVARSGEVLQLVRAGVSTTSELATTMGLARSTVAERVELLREHELLKVTGEVGTGRGRPAANYAFNAGAGSTLVSQVGVSGSRVAVTDLSGEVLRSVTIDLDLSLGPVRVLDAIGDRFEALARESAISMDRVRGVGLGLPGRVELETLPPNDREPSWIDFDVRGHLSARFGVPTHLDRDVNLLALGEHRTHWADTDVFLCVKAGTVIGCGLVIGGGVVTGDSGLAGEIGHTRVAGSTVSCACGNVGCLNMVAGGGALAAELSRSTGTPVASAREVARLARGGNVVASQAVRDSGRHIGEVLAAGINLLNPEVITVWGYLTDAGDQLLAGIREAIHRSAVPAATRSLKLENARLGDDAGIRGAALMVADETLQPTAIDAYLLRQ